MISISLGPSTKADLDRFQRAGEPTEKQSWLVAGQNPNSYTVRNNINPRQKLGKRKFESGYKVPKVYISRAWEDSQIRGYPGLYHAILDPIQKQEPHNRMKRIIQA